MANDKNLDFINPKKQKIEVNVKLNKDGNYALDTIVGSMDLLEIQSTANDGTLSEWVIVKAKIFDVSITNVNFDLA